MEDLKTRKWLIILLLLISSLGLIVLFFFRGCYDSEKKPFIANKKTPLLVSILVTPQDFSLAIGKEQEFIATGIYSDESQIDITTTVFWSTYPRSVATINNLGLAKAVGRGTAIIMAIWGDFHGKTNLKVSGPPLIRPFSKPETPIEETKEEPLPMAILSESEKRFTVGTGIEADCVIDNQTGLMWVKSPENTILPWDEANDFAKILSLCGYTDWKIPQRRELRSLINFKEPDLASWLNSFGFNIQSVHYWSSTVAALNPKEAWVIYLGHPYKDKSVKKTSHYYNWPVRFGPKFMGQ